MNTSEADAFLKVAGQYQLGELDTEGQHPFTLSLSELAQSDLDQAIVLLHQVDVLALRRFEYKAAPVSDLAAAIAATFRSGHRVFLCGCGATGRLSLSLEVFCKAGELPVADPDKVIAFMAGGDLALIKSIENFEDHPDYGARQLEELGFVDGDLLISTTEGGETPFVIGATLRAAELSHNRPWFLYCNPDSQLRHLVERSRQVLEDDRIRKFNLAIGAMAVAGSTRMQASTVLMAAVGIAIRHHADPENAPRAAVDLRAAVGGLSFSFLEPFIEREAQIYQSGGYVFYESDRYGITVVTDTTERAPTFSVPPFENQNDPSQPPSWCHYLIPEARDPSTAWRTLLHRAPRTLEWPDVRDLAGSAALGGYDMSAHLPIQRRVRTKDATHHHFKIEDSGELLAFHLDDLRYELPLPGATPLARHLVLKMALNIHSTLVMGRLGRYLDNLMTYVKPSNNKLIDRAIRYVRLLMQRRTGTVPPYAEVARTLFEVKKDLRPEEPIVARTLERLLARRSPAHAL